MKSNLPFLVVVDVQRGYEESIEDKVYDFVHKINTTDQNIVVFYVGKEFDLDTKEDVMFYFLEHGLDESKLDSIKFIEKTYGYLRSWMDLNVEREIIIEAIKLMDKEKIYDSRDFTDEQFDQITNGRYSQDNNLRYKITQDHIFYPGDFSLDIFKLPEFNHIEVIGGGRHECLEEIALILQGIGKDIEINESLCYGSDKHEKKKKKKNKINF